MRKIRDENGNIYYGIDEDLRERLQAKLMRAVLSFKTEKAVCVFMEVSTYGQDPGRKTGRYFVKGKGKRNPERP